MPYSNVPHVTCEHLQKLAESGEKKEHLVLDLRDPLEFESGHIEGSKNVPRKELSTNIENIVPEKGGKVIVVVGVSEEKDLETIHNELSELGYGSVEFLAGGFDKWCEIAAIDVGDELADERPAEGGGEDLSDLDPANHDNEPQF